VTVGADPAVPAGDTSAVGMVEGGPEVVGVVDGAAVVAVVEGVAEELLHAVRPRATTDRTTTVRVRARVMEGSFPESKAVDAERPRALPPEVDTVVVSVPFAVSRCPRAHLGPRR
jgi:hypothetical protein